MLGRLLVMVAFVACAPPERPPDEGEASPFAPAGSGDGHELDPCSPAALGRSYVGCEYSPTVTANIVSNVFTFAVAISNASIDDARITIDGGALVGPRTFIIEPGRVRVE